MPWTGVGSAVVGGLLGLGSGMLNNAFNSSSTKEAYKYQRKLLQAQMDYNERMSNTAHQREVADLRAAGINPILSAGTSGASAGVVSAPSVSTQAPSNISLDAAMDAYSAAQTAQAQKLNANAAGKQADVADKKADIEAAAQKSQAAVDASLIKKNEAEAALAAARAGAVPSEISKNKNLRLPGGAEIRGQDIDSLNSLFSEPWLGSGSRSVFSDTRYMNSAGKNYKPPYFRPKTTWELIRNVDAYIKNHGDQIKSPRVIHKYRENLVKQLKKDQKKYLNDLDRESRNLRGLRHGNFENWR